MAPEEPPRPNPPETNPSAAESTEPAPVRKRTHVQWILAGLLTPGLVSVAILLVIGPTLLLTTTTPTGFDLGGHVYPLSVAAERMPGQPLPGWSDGWFGGFPLYYFYFPLPAILVWVVGMVAPFEVAVKLVSVLGVVFLPFAAYVLARGVGFSRPVAAACVLGAGAFAFMQSYDYLGGNLSSTLAGEFSYGMGFTLSLIYLGLVARAARGGPRLGFLAAFVLAGTALSHVLPAFVVVVATLPLLTIRRAQRPVWVSWVVGFMLAGFWTVPFLLRYALLPDVLWDAPRTAWDVFPREIWPLLPLALAGAILTVRHRWAALLLVPPVVGLAFYAAGPAAVHPGRLLPYWFFAVHLLAAMFTGGAIQRYVRERTPVALASGLLGILAFGVVLGAREYRDLRTWAAWDYSGYETKPGWPTYSALIETFRQLPPGRVHWEDASVIASFGSLNALTLLPYWSPGHPAVGGLWLESSLAAPAVLRAKKAMSHEEASRSDPRIPDDVAMDFPRGVALLRLQGARYYVAFTPEAIAAARDTEGLVEVAAAEPFSIFDLGPPDLVEVAAKTPVVHEEGDFQVAGSAWLDRPEGFGRLLVAEGPAGWPRHAEALEDETSSPYGRTGDARRVSDVVVNDSEITFTTSAVGVPHFIKASWFPNWRAEGAIGPYLAAPSAMVVVPNRENVRLRFRRSWAEWLGMVISVLGVAAFASGVLHHGVTWAFFPRSKPGS